MRIPPLAADALIAAALCGVALLLGPEAARQGRVPLDATAYALVVLVHLPLVLRGRAPVVICCVVHANWLVFITAGYWPVVCSFGPMLAVYTVASLRPSRISVPCAVLLGATWIYSGVAGHADGLPAVAGQAVVYPAVLWRFGVVARRSAELTRRLRREQAERARRAVAEERGRIARELHDVVAHHMSVISVQTGLARFVFDTDPPTARTALDTIGATGKEALEELRRMLAVLRADDGDDNGASGDNGDNGDNNDNGSGGAPGSPMPGLARLEEMAERVRAAGVPVTLTVEGTPRPLAPGVDLCAYRVIQEALTNVLRHAPGARAEVRLEYRPHHLTVSVTDNGQEVILDRLHTGGGHGLIGMRERAKLYGGRISIGPREEGGFAVRLILPTSARGAAGGDDAAT
ncbi:sensor histidine kinase [Streptomyces aidingensis]|uniref:histidine kinase n=1 Tax=Streptomyces aidingensis TaxID=910347 RepID=A0A1I1LBR5_9ACTN|nr:sensor histidine kinase [Streptomyces aidingensis]SFC70534.1 Histidine kinase-, DNA gyrase B-, and HSP90-like ATPase [Streptomyces aidingensis]